ncbi:hypothetical protein [Oricola sp.]|uniref:hypothetical protein n=1 Tax=Oricola sp. TaxID=1979950 RepID=UPI003BAC6875
MSIFVRRGGRDDESDRESVEPAEQGTPTEPQRTDPVEAQDAHDPVVAGDGNIHEIRPGVSAAGADQSKFDEFEKYVGELDANFATLGDIEENLSKMKLRAQWMKEYAQKWRLETVRHEEVIVQRDRYLDEATRSADRIKELEKDKSDLALKMDTVLELNDSLKADLNTAHRSLESLRADVDTLGKERDRLYVENADRASRLGEMEADAAHFNREVSRLKEAKNDLAKELVQAKNAASEAEFKLTGLHEQLEDAGKMQQKLMTAQEKNAEERRLLKREAAALETKLANYEIKMDRLQSENEAVIARLASEKFAMQMETDSQRAEIRSLSKMRQDSEKTVLSLQKEIAQARLERDEAVTSYKDIVSTLETGRRDLTNANHSLSELNLKYSVDLIALDQLREENKDLVNRIEILQSENKRLAEYEVRYRASELRSTKLKEELARQTATGAAARPVADTAAAARGADKTVTDGKDRDSELPSVSTADDETDFSNVTKH